jgi:hypothetical protein
MSRAMPVRSASRELAALAVVLGLACAVVASPQGCTRSAPLARAERVANRSQLVGGPDALGDVGDFKLSNGKVRFVIQGITTQRGVDKVYSRGWGVYAGSLLDADLVRPDTSAGSRPNGKDQFGELFPAYFLEAIEPAGPESVTIGNDGGNGQPATVIVKGRGAPFLSTADNLIKALLSPDGLDFTTTYSLGADDQFLTITSEVVDESRDRDFRASFAGINLGIPFGHVLLFGSRNHVFVPGAGFDLRTALEREYKREARLPALPGVVADIVATTAGEGVSYGFAMAEPENPENNYTYRNREKIGLDASGRGATPTTMMVPFIASSFTGVFSAQPPDDLPRGTPFRFSSYFIVGNGDVGSVRDVAYGIRRPSDASLKLGRFAGRVVEAGSRLAVPGASMVVLDHAGRAFSQYSPDAEGRVRGTLPAGDYSAVLVADHHPTSAPIPFRVVEGEVTDLRAPDETGNDSTDLLIPQGGLVNVRVSDRDGGRALPAKVTLVATYGWNAANAGKRPQEFLYDLALGERMRPTDGVPDAADEPASREYVERVILGGPDGRASGTVKPGSYVAVVSRGPEYDVQRIPDVVVRPGQVLNLEARLQRVVETDGAISADFHIHSANSIDASIGLSERVASYAAEGVEYMASTDHNFVTDYRPVILKDGYEEFVNSTVGLEMTTLEMGHFNAFPITYERGAITHGAFDWVNVPPPDLFTALRSLAPKLPDGRSVPTVVQVNHPRDTILGYFNQFNVDPETHLARPGNPIASPTGPAFAIDQFSRDYDAIEVFNGKRYEYLRTFRMPATPPAGAPTVPLAAGDIVRTPCPADKPACNYARQPIAFPGVVDDWFVMLNQADHRPVTGTGNSDSHELYFEEAGYPRNWVLVGDTEPRAVTDLQLAEAVQRHKVVFSNGPYIDLVADGSSVDEKRQGGVGDLFVPTGDTVKLDLEVRAAPWISVQRVLVYVNGQEVRRLTLPDERLQPRRCCSEALELKLTADSWIVVAAEGDASMWPVVAPLELAPILISDAIKAIAGPIGIGDDGMGTLRPPVTGPTRPFAMTNPVWVDRDGDGRSFGRTSEVLETPGQPLLAPGTRVLRTTAPRLPEVPEARKLKRSSDLRKLFEAWGHGHGH